MEVSNRGTETHTTKVAAKLATRLSKLGPQKSDCWKYIENVKIRFADEVHMYHQFLDILQDFKDLNIDTPKVITRVAALLQGNEDLLVQFNSFLPSSFSIWFTYEKTTGKTVTGFLGPHGFEEFPRFIDATPISLPQKCDITKTHHDL